MKIEDFTSRKWFTSIFYTCVLFAFLGGVIFQRRPINEVLVLVIILGLPMSGFIYFDFLDRRWYIIDETGITAVFLRDKLKRHFNWNELSAAKIHNLKVKRYAPLECTMVLSFDKNCALVDEHSYVWYLRRSKSIVIFKFTMERYEYIRQFCDLPLKDNR